MAGIEPWLVNCKRNCWQWKGLCHILFWGYQKRQKWQELIRKVASYLCHLPPWFLQPSALWPFLVSTQSLVLFFQNKSVRSSFRPCYNPLKTLYRLFIPICIWKTCFSCKALHGLSTPYFSIAVMMATNHRKALCCLTILSCLKVPPVPAPLCHLKHSLEVTPHLLAGAHSSTCPSTSAMTANSTTALAWPKSRLVRSLPLPPFLFFFLNWAYKRRRRKCRHLPAYYLV